MNQKLISWSDFLYIGLAFAVMLSVRDEYQDSFYMLIPVAVFFLLTGVKENVRRLTEFIKKFPIFAVLTVIWTLYYAFVENSGMKSYRYAAAVFFIVFAGYAAAMCEKKELSVAFDRLWTVLFVLLLTGVVNYVIVHEFGERMHMFFLNPIPEGDAALVLALISLFYIIDRRRKAVGILLSVIVMVVAQLRHDTLLLLALLVIYAVMKRAEIKAFVEEKIIRSRREALIVGLGLAVAAGFVVVLLVKGVKITALQVLVGRFTDMFAATAKDVYLNYYGDTGFRFRVVDLDMAINVFRNGELLKQLFGGGILYTYYKIKPMAELLLGASGDTAGPVENSFIALLSDYGAFAFVFYTGVYVSAISTAIKSKTKAVRIQSLVVIFSMSVSLFSDMHYWTNIAFLIFVLAGVYLGELVKADEKWAVYPALLFCALLALFLDALPVFYSWIRTVITAATCSLGVPFTMLVFTVAVAALLVILWNVSVLVVSFITNKKVLRNNYVAGIAGAAVLLLFFAFGTAQIAGVKKTVIPRIDAEKDVLDLVRNNAKGSVYTDTFPLIYSDQLGNVKGTLFSGASLAASKDTTIIMSAGDEAQKLSNTGFLYLPVSECDSIYTNDQGVIDALKAEGYKPTGYNSLRKYVDLQKTADSDGLQITEDGSLLLEGAEKSIKKGAEADVFPGKFTATYDLELENKEYDSDYPVCELVIKNKDAEEKVATATITRGMFDDNGKLSYDLVFNGDVADCIFQVLMDSDEIMKVNSISYVRTPDMDVHIRTDEYGRTLLEEYFDLEGNPIDISAEYHGQEFAYDDKGEWNYRCYLNRELKPVIISSGYAQCRRKLDDKNRVIREEYYGDDGNPIVLTQGQAAVEYEYDENGNRTVDRYYDAELKPILYSGQYYFVKRTYNDKKQNILEKYFGTDEKPIALSDGACGYRREYDASGNETVTEYLGEDGKPVLNTSGYAIRRRTFDDKNQITREDYYDESDNPIVLSFGMAAVEYEYDDAGNRTVSRYYDTENVPVLCNGAYWMVEVSYNDLNQNILEKYYGTDGKPITLSDGAAGYERGYDEAGNLNVLTFLDSKGKPTMNISAYSSWRRSYNDKGQIVREEYYDTEDAPIALSDGQAAVEYGYDDAGNRTVDKYYDIAGNPVLYAGEFWYVVRTYNDKKQNIHEDYYGLDGKLIMRPAGYCSVDIKYDDAGVAVGRIYYDQDGAVVAEE